MKPLLNKIFYCLLLLVSLFSAQSEEPPFKVQRMLTDFRGIVTNGTKTICYGDYGIMTYTTDAGQSWKQDNWGDKYNIMKVETDGSDFFGVTDYFLFRSYNKVSYWLYQPIFEESKIIDMTLKGDSIFILTKDGILLSDKEMNISSTILTLDSESTYSELKTDGINLYFINNDTLLLIFNLELKNLDTVNLGSYIDCKICNKEITDLRIFDDKIYIILNKIVNQMGYWSCVARSDNYGKDWVKITQDIYDINCYKIINDSVYILNPGKIRDSSDDAYLILNYYRNDTSHYRIDTTIIDTNIFYTRVYIKGTINILDTLPQKHIYSMDRYNNKFSINDFIFLNDDTIFVVGSNKMISVSYNKGKSFEYKSFFNGSNDGSRDNIQFISDSLIYVVNDYTFNKTTNGGITWLPQNYRDYKFRDSNNRITKYGGPQMFYFDKNGRGFAKYPLINRDNDSSALITDDFGENFYKTDNKDLIIPLKEEEGLFTFKQKGIDLGDVFLFFANSLKDSLYGESYQILRYDKTFKMLDSNRLNAGKFIQISKLTDDYIISLNLKSFGENKADSTGKTEDYLYYYYLLKSTDKGKTWDSVDVEVPILQKFRKRYNSNDYFYYNTVANSQLVFNNYILYPTTEKIIYKYDFVNNKFDSLFYPGIIDQFSPISPIFKYYNKLFVISLPGNNTIYYTNDLNSEYPKWDSLEPGTGFGQWNNFINSENKDAILFSNMFTDSTGFLVIGKSQIGGFGSWEFKINFAKIIRNPLVNVDEQKIEIENVYLWNSIPYPIPGTNIIQSKIFWKDNLNIENAKIIIFDINGEKIYNNIKLEQETANSGIFTWNTENINSGIYIIQILIGGESLSFPVIINK